MKSKLLLLLSVILMSGCSLFQPEIVVQTELVYTKVTCPDYPAPAGIHMMPVKPRAIQDVDGLVWVGFTPRHYGDMGINHQEFIRYIKAQKGQIKYYHSCIIDFNIEINRLQNLKTMNHD
ncbi:MAG: hypothetical protein GY829_08590 [Gammaproteobacteria bacterium]|nr:hypothetical protein [Gammaproteobacteria bacterium]